ncbi:hypothetical protein [Streptomyces albidus (ex Kaewkla and Franco 2022)]|uniref:hypothetical protein n=1 Tax=Streptomyces albidus (ex Kaewkla and Franco 2022) TaxID=722709 RepID=UPI0015EEAAC1|nr:hypothetical protein [Streptomyces albidus (ex Kaewkla and Franco 2022)]
MTTPRRPGCKAAGSDCGEPAGWRRGGRCPRCRAARQAEAERDRGLRSEQRDRALAVLRSGGNADSAAAAMGGVVADLSAAALHDGELRAALDGRPVEQQLLARKGDYLAALTRTGGDPRLAAMAIGVEEEQAVEWLSDSAYADAERAVRVWIAETVSGPRQQVADEMLDKAADLLRDGMTITAAARAIGVSAATLRNRADGHPRLAAALPPKKSYRRQSGQLPSASVQ